MTGFPVSVCIHVIVFAATISLMILTNQNPRVILIAITISVLLRLLTIWFVARFDRHNLLASLLARLTRLPQSGDRCKPYRDQKSREPVGIAAYLSGYIGLLGMLTTIIIMADGTNVLQPRVFLPDLIWALSIGFLYLIDDLLGQQMVYDPAISPERNLGYHTATFNFLLATLFVGGFLNLLIQFPVFFTGTAQETPWFGWILLFLLGAIRLTYQIQSEKRSSGFKRLAKAGG